MKTITVTADMIDSAFFDKFYDSTDGNDYSNLDVANTESYELEVDVDGEERSVAVSVYTKFINMKDAHDLIIGGYDNAEKIYNKLSWIKQKWEVTHGFCESDIEIIVEPAAQDKLDTLHDEWEDNNRHYVIDHIERMIEELKEEQV